MNIIEKITGTLHKLRYNNIIANNYYSKKRKQLLNKEFIDSSEYDQLMTKYQSTDDTNKLNDAELRSENFKFRHMKFHKVLGAWRWKALWQYKDLIGNYVFNDKIQGIDFGGANGPISLTTTIVDFAQNDSFKRPVRYKTLADLDFKLDFIFSSHTLEHIEKLDDIFIEMKKHLKENAMLFFLVPSYSCVRWRSGIHTNKAFNDHAWTFCLEKDENKLDYENILAIDKKVAQHFEIENASYVGDDSILIVAKN